jgi:hypothetical protein
MRDEGASGSVSEKETEKTAFPFDQIDRYADHT